jgi:hypothetical protein
MTSPHRSRSPGRWLLVALAGLVPAAALLSPAAAAGAEKPKNSLQWIPQDAAYYSSIFRTGEMLRAIGKSRAWAKVKALPVVKAAWEKFQAEWSEEGRLSLIYNAFQTKENKQLIALLGDMFSREAFVYGGDGWVEFSKLWQEMNGYSSYFRLLPRMVGLKGQDAGKLGVAMYLDILADNLKGIRAPDTVIGFRLSKKARARDQIKRLEEGLKKLVELVPQLEGRVKRVKVAGGSFVTLRLDGSLVPWDRFPVKDFETRPGQYDEVIKRLKELKLTLAVGLRGDYLLLSIGATTSPLTKLAKGPLLVERKEFKPFARFANKRVTSVSYSSKKLQQATASSGALDTLVSAGKEFLRAVDLTDKQRAKIEKDMGDFGKDLRPYFPVPGPQLSFSFLTARGLESYTYDWTKYPDRDGSRPLSLLKHAGGNPLVVLVTRAKNDPKQYQLLVKWLKVGFGYFEEFGVPNLPEDVREKYKEFAKALLPLARRLDEATGKMLLPALADGQLGVVLEAKARSKQWFRQLPASDKKLPMLQPALLAGVSDAALLRKAFSEYRAIANDLLAKLHELMPEQVPALKISLPNAQKFKTCTIYSYPLPRKWGLDKQITPNMALGEKVAALTAFRSQSRRLLTETPLRVTKGPLANQSRPLAMAFYLNWAAVVDALAPWVEFGVKELGPRILQLDVDDPNEKAAADKALDDIHKQARTVLQVLKVVRSCASVTYLQDGAWVTHTEIVIKDVPAR